MSDDPILTSPRHASDMPVARLIEFVRPLLQQPLDPPTQIFAARSDDPADRFFRAEQLRTSPVATVWWVYSQSADHPVVADMIADALRLQGWDLQAWKYAVALRPIAEASVRPGGLQRAITSGLRPHSELDAELRLARCAVGGASAFWVEVEPDVVTDGCVRRRLWFRLRGEAWAVAESRSGVSLERQGVGAWSDPMPLKSFAHHLAGWLRKEIKRVVRPEVIARSD